jgi:hypothetical protein
MESNLQDSLLAAQFGAYLDPFSQEIDFLPATLSTTTTGQFVVGSDAPFAICETVAWCTDTSNALAATVQPFGLGMDALLPFTVTLNDSGAGRSLSNIAVPLDSLFGTGTRPHIWTVPKILNANSTFVVVVQNLSATSRNLRLSFHGWKIFGNASAFLAKVKPQ